MDTMIRMAESGLLPDGLVRVGIRRLLRQRLRRERDGATASPAARGTDTLAPIAVATGEANEQHYELPADFFRLMLGPHLKYSSCHWSSPRQSLAEAEEEMLRLTCERAGIADGMSVLDLGSGWGSLGLWIAERFPGCRVTTVSNSRSQQELIGALAAERGLRNLQTMRADINHFRPTETFDRVCSVEMFEHVRNHAELLSRIAGWLEPQGRLFVHIFCHRELCYPFELDGDGDWMARYFFTGGLMPSLDMLNRLDDSLRVTRRWEVCGTHYARTLRAWLQRLDDNRSAALRLLGDHYGADQAGNWLERWRLFLMACEELFAFGRGQEWLVGHYLMERR